MGTTVHIHTNVPTCVWFDCHSMWFTLSVVSLVLYDMYCVCAKPSKTNKETVNFGSDPVKLLLKLSFLNSNKHCCNTSVICLWLPKADQVWIFVILDQYEVTTFIPLDRMIWNICRHTSRSCNFWFVHGTEFIFVKHFPWIKHFQMPSLLTSLLPWHWDPKRPR